MKELVFDIETAGFNFDSLKPAIQKYLLKKAKNETEVTEEKTKTGLCPLSGEVVSIAFMNLDQKASKVYFQAPNGEKKNFREKGVEYEIKTEKEMLEGFWRGLQNFERIITFNGRSFDVPFLILRSIYHKIPITKNLVPYRYSGKIHFDLMDQLSFYGAHKNYSLAALADFFGIDNPKDEGISGLEVNNLFQQEKYDAIAKYCMRDVLATAELYLRVKDYFKDSLR